MGPSVKARGGDQAGCCTEVEVDMLDVFLDDKNAGLSGARVGLQRRVVPICLR